MNDQIEDIVAFFTQTRKEEFHAVCHMVNEVRNVIEFDFAGLIGRGYEIGIRDKEQRKCEELVIGNQRVFVFVCIRSGSI